MSYTISQEENGRTHMRADEHLSAWVGWVELKRVLQVQSFILGMTYWC